jgi:hypothetical protein
MVGITRTLGSIIRSRALSTSLPLGGLVEAISEVTAGREAHARFLFSATVDLFEQNGFTRRRRVGKHAWILSRDIDAA